MIDNIILLYNSDTENIIMIAQSICIFQQRYLEQITLAAWIPDADA